jgi:hypothetical protein
VAKRFGNTLVPGRLRLLAPAASTRCTEASRAATSRCCGPSVPDSAVSSVIAFAILGSVVLGRPLMSAGLKPYMTRVKSRTDGGVGPAFHGLGANPRPWLAALLRFALL